MFSAKQFLRRHAWCVALAVVMTPALVPAQDLVVYGDSLDSGWENWSWDNTINFSSTNPVHGGSNAIRVQPGAAWAGFYLHSTSPLSTSDYNELRLWIHGGTAGGQQLQLAVMINNTTEAQRVTPTLTANAWNEVVVDLDAIGSFDDFVGFYLIDSAGATQATYHVDDIVLRARPGGAAAPALTLDNTTTIRPIDPHIYGINFADDDFAQEIGLPINRWGGNHTTRYNWRLDVHHRARDWFFVSIAEPVADVGALPHGSSADRFVQANKNRGTDTLLTIPMIGWTPKSRTKLHSFSVTKYGAQQATEPGFPDIGNGIRPNGTPVTGNDPNDSCEPIGPSFVTDWMAHLAGNFGTAATGGVRYYALDNEPMLWDSTHRDVHPAGVGYDEILAKTVEYAPVIKATDPNAKILGPVLWGWDAYFYSAKDREDGGAWWETRSDRRAHGDIPFVEWYLQQMAAYETNNGVRILDYLDLHFYPEGGIALESAGDANAQALRLRSTRSLWDPTYVEETFIQQPVRLIPRMRDWVNTHYPGTKLALTEYNWGGLEHINGALAQAEILGIFGREGLDMATLWSPPLPSEPGSFAFRMFRNYDGAGSRFGDQSLAATTSNHAKVSIFAARRTSDNAVTAIVINKTGVAQESALTLTGLPASGAAEVYTYSSANLSAIVNNGTVGWSGGQFTFSYPANSITMVELPAGSTGVDRELWIVE